MRPGREWVRLQPLMHQHSLLVLGTGVSPHFALQSLSRIAIAMHCIGSVLVGQIVYVNKYKRERNTVYTILCFQNCSCCAPLSTKARTHVLCLAWVVN